MVMMEIRDTMNRKKKLRLETLWESRKQMSDVQDLYNLGVLLLKTNMICSL